MTTAVQPLTPQQRRQRNRAEMRAAILDAARAIMREEGAAGLNLNELARRVGVRTPSLYEYFPNKAAIYDALFRLGFELFDAMLSDKVQSAATWQQAVRAQYEGYLAFAHANPELYQLCFERPVPGFVPSEESLAFSFGALGKAVQQVAGYLESGELNSGLPPQQTLDLAIALIHGLTALHLANEPHLPPGEGRFGALVPAAVDLLRRAWEPPVPARPRRRTSAKKKEKLS